MALLERITLGLSASAHSAPSGLRHGTNKKCARIQRCCDLFIFSIFRGERVDEIQTRRRRRDFGRMDVAVHPQGGLVRIITGFEIRCGDEPDISALITFADAFELE